MPVQPYNTRSPLAFNVYQPDFIGKPIQQIGNTMLSMSNANHAIVDNANKLHIALSNLNIAPIDQDILIKQKNDFDNTINDIANNGNIETAQARLNKLYTDYATNKGLKAAISRYASYNQQRAAIMKNKNKWNPKDYAWMMSRPFTKTQADENGYYEPYVLPTLLQEYNPTKNLEHIADKTPFIDVQGGMQEIKDANGNIIGYKQIVTKQKDINKLRTSLYNAVLSDDKAVAYARQRAAIDNEYGIRMQDKNGNIRPVTENDIIDKWITPLIQQYDVKSDESKSTYDLKAMQANQANNDIPHGEKTTTPGMISNNTLLTKLSNLINPDSNTPHGLPQHTAANVLMMSGYGVPASSNSFNEVQKAIKNHDNDTKTNILNNIQSNINKLDPAQKSIINDNINRYSRNTYNKDFNSLSNSEKINVYKTISTALENNNKQIHNITYTRFDVKRDANQIRNYINLFTNSSNGTIKSSNGTSLVSNNWEGNKIWNYTDGKLMSSSEMKKYLNKVPKGTRVMVEGKVAASNILSSITGDYGFSGGIVVSIGGKQFIVASNIANTHEYGNRGYSMAYDAVNSLSNNRDRMFDRYVPLDTKYIVHGKDSKSYLDSVLDEPAGTFDSAAYMMPAITGNDGKPIIVTNQNELPYANQLVILDKNGNIIKDKNGNPVKPIKADNVDKIFTIIGQYAKNSR